MGRIATLSVAVAALAAWTTPVVAAPAKSSVAEMGWLAGLAGSCWSGTGAGNKATDVQCYEVRYGSFLKGTIRMAAPGSGKTFEGEGIFAWDAANRRIVFWNWASDGSYGEGTAALEDGSIVFDLAAAAAPTRTIWRRLDRDSFRVVKERKEGEAWKAVLTVTYRRAPASPR